jgi:hypothetical protein
MARSCFSGSKTDVSHATLPECGSTAVMPCCQLVKMSAGACPGGWYTQGVE